MIHPIVIDGDGQFGHERNLGPHASVIDSIRRQIQQDIDREIFQMLDLMTKSGNKRE